MTIGDLCEMGLSNKHTNIDRFINDRESDLTKILHENKRKSYPQRNNRTKLNYRDLERGMYEQIRQSTWSLSSSTLMNKNEKNHRPIYDDVIDLTIDDDDDDDEKTNGDTDQFHRRLWCICKMPWDHSKLMLRCDSCANWFHGDCVGMTKEEAKELELDGNDFVCSSCQELQDSESIVKSSNDSIPIKRKHSHSGSTTDNLGKSETKVSSGNISNGAISKRSKNDIDFQRTDSLSESKVDCIAYGCNNAAKPNRIFCSSPCISRHVNDRLQTVRRSKAKDNDDIPAREDIALYDNKSKTILEKSLVPRIEDLHTWLNQHPSYEIIQISSKCSVQLRENQSTNLASSLTSVVSTAKSKPLSKPITTNQQNDTKPNQHKKISTQNQKTINNTTTDIRSKVPSTLYDKILMRLEKNGEDNFTKGDIRLIANQIEKEMFHVYGKVDNTYKNKFRSLIANISNMNNNFFYKQILSKEITAKQIVAMKPEDMLPPEEKEKRKDQFEKEVQSIMLAEQLLAEERARRARIKIHRQDFIDNDAALPIHISTETSSWEKKIDKSKDNLSINITKNPTQSNSTTNESSIENTNLQPIFNAAHVEQTISKLASNSQTSSSTLTENPPSTSLTKKINNSDESSKSLTPITTIREQSNTVLSTMDLDNDYIEPESPTGVDALIYDDEEVEEDDNNISVTSISSTSHSPNDFSEFMISSTSTTRDDYNPSKIQDEPQPKYQLTPVVRSTNKWHGTIYPSDMKIACQSVHVYGENDYLIENIPKHLIVLGRLRLHDLWDFIRNSLTVRDILILTLVSSSLNTNDNDSFLKYVDALDSTKRAAVISKCSGSSSIRDMYILAADTKDCPPDVLSSLSVPKKFESKQLFLVIVGSNRKTMKSSSCSNENRSVNNLVYNPIPLQDSTTIRDPRLLKAKDTRLNNDSTTDTDDIIFISQTSGIQQTSIQSSQDDLLKLIFDSLECIRHAVKSDDIHPIVTSTMEILTTNNRDDLCTQFTDRLRVVMNAWKAKQENSSVIADDNLIEENMDVDNDNDATQDDKAKKPIITSSTSKSLKRSRDFDYRFTNQDKNPPTPITITAENDGHRRKRRKSRFSDRLPTDDDDDDHQSNKATLNFQNDIIFLKEIGKNPSSINTQIASDKLTDKHTNSSLNSKVQLIVNSSESFLASTNTKDKLISKPIRFSFSKDPFQRQKPNSSSTATSSTNNEDIYESSPKFIEDLMRKVQSYGYKGLSLSNDNWTKKTLPITPIRSTAMLNLVTQQQKTKHRLSSSTNEWRSSNHKYVTHYHDFDQPQE
ncbi:unnamed protein product [Rotaria socialis]